jgi:hypothetical protein
MAFPLLALGGLALGGILGNIFRPRPAPFSDASGRGTLGPQTTPTVAQAATTPSPNRLRGTPGTTTLTSRTPPVDTPVDTPTDTPAAPAPDETPVDPTPSTPAPPGEPSDPGLATRMGNESIQRSRRRDREQQALSNAAMN